MTMAASYAVLKSSLVTILKMLAQAKETSRQFRRNVQLMQPYQGGTLQTVVSTKVTMMPMASAVTTSSGGIKTVHFVT